METLDEAEETPPETDGAQTKNSLKDRRQTHESGNEYGN